MASLQEVIRLVDWKEEMPLASHKVLRSIEACHTAKMGYHAYRCNDQECGHIHIQYHGCRNRHCPHCGSLRAQNWMEDRLRELLPVKYFHVVFTLPSELKTMAYLNRKAFYNLLFDSSAHCLLTVSKDPKFLGATPSISSVLHTWGQQLDFHPHIHCIVSGGGVSKDFQWKPIRQGKGTFLFPYGVMEPIYKGFFLEKLNAAISNKHIKLPEHINWPVLRNKLYNKKWIVFAKNPMGNASQVVEYLGRYTQKIAISNHRIKQIDEQANVHFSYKDYREHGKKKLLKLAVKEFLRRFCMHILPARFVRIRHYGFLGNYKRRERIEQILKKFGVPKHPQKLKVPTSIANLCRLGSSELSCPKCKKGNLLLHSVLLPRCRDDPHKSLHQYGFGLKH